jgi:hypothetical protein
MTNYLREFQEALEDFLDLTVYFNENEMQYKFQGIWTSSHFEKDIQEKAKKLEYLLSRQLKYGRDNKALLSEIQEKMKETYNFLLDVYYTDFDNLAKSNLKIRYSSELPAYISADLYTYEFFENSISNEKVREKFLKGNIQFTALLESLLKLFERFQRDDKSPNRQQFENLKLLECIYCYREILDDFLDTVEHFISGFDKIDFSKIETTEFQLDVETIKCNLNLSKRNTAKLFKFFMVENYLYFDLQDERKNKRQLEEFIQNNFTYRALNKKQENIVHIDKEFSEFRLDIKEYYNNLIDELIGILESKRKI